MPAGRPLLFADPDDLQVKIDEYFVECDKGRKRQVVTKRGDVVEIMEPVPYTMEGLAIYLDCDADTVRNYGKRDAFFGTISRARERIQRSWMENGLNGTFNPKIVNLALAATCKDYRVSQENNHNINVSVEGILQRLQGSQAQQIEHQDPDTQDAEVIE